MVRYNNRRYNDKSVRYATLIKEHIPLMQQENVWIQTLRKCTYSNIPKTFIDKWHHLKVPVNWNVFGTDSCGRNFKNKIKVRDWPGFLGRYDKYRPNLN